VGWYVCDLNSAGCYMAAHKKTMIYRCKVGL
jgi:hypothetical protein